MQANLAYSHPLRCAIVTENTVQAGEASTHPPNHRHCGMPVPAAAATSCRTKSTSSSVSLPGHSSMGMWPTPCKQAGASSSLRTRQAAHCSLLYTDTAHAA